MYIKVIAYPGAKKEVALRKKENIFEIKLKEPAERNLANNRIKEVLAEIFSVNPKIVRLISGHHSNRKIFSLPDDIIANQ